LNVRDGVLTHSAVAQVLGEKFVDPEQLLQAVVTA